MSSGNAILVSPLSEKVIQSIQDGVKTSFFCNNLHVQADGPCRIGDGRADDGDHRPVGSLEIAADALQVMAGGLGAAQQDRIDLSVVQLFDDPGGITGWADAAIGRDQFDRAAFGVQKGFQSAVSLLGPEENQSFRKPKLLIGRNQPFL